MRSTRTPRWGRNWLRRGGGIALLTAVFGLAVATPAFAHPYLLSSDPASGAILQSAPSQIDITYTEGLDRSYCNVVLIAPNGQHISTEQVRADSTNELSVVPQRALAQDGTYAVEWTAVGDDGHTVIGNFGFSLGHPSANAAVASSGGVSTTGSAAGTAGLQRLLRTVLPFATSVFAGVLLLASFLVAAGRRGRRLIQSAYVLQAVPLGALVIDVVLSGGWSRFGSSDTGRRLIAELALTVLALPALSRPRLRRAFAPAVAVALLVMLALSGHASSQPHSRRLLAITVYSIHLVAVSVWLAALIAVVVAPERRRSLRTLVVVSLGAVLISGLATTDWALRNLHDLPDTSYGKLAITLVALFVAIVAIGALAARRRWLLGVEAIVAVGALLVAGELGEVAQPLDQPYPSQTYAAVAGLPVSVAAAGPDALDVGVLAPGILGRNTLVIEVGDADEQDFLSPASDVRSVRATVSCGGCGAPDQHLTLHRSGGGAAWTADVDLTTPASWLVTATVQRAGKRPGAATSTPVELAERITPATLPHQVVVGVPASLSGSVGETCRDEVLGLQDAFADLNTSVADHGDLIRVAAVDLHDGVPAALDRLRSLGARLIALPCGTASQVAAITTAARRSGLPVVAGAAASDAVGAGVWSTQPSWQAEGAAIAEQAIAQQATSVTAIVGTSSIDGAELTGLRAGLATRHVVLRIHRFPANADSYVDELAREHSDVVALLGDPYEAAPLVHAFSAAANQTGWTPSHGILASAQLMSTDFINDAGTITRLGGIEFASDINPFDPVSQYYAQRLRTLSPGLRPSFNGLHGYEAGLAIAAALRNGGGAPSSARLTALFGSDFHDFRVGSYRLGWQASGGTSTSLAFFRSTYVNPMAMPSNTPGGASALAHEGTFLDSGGFEQVAPFRTLR